jgi:Ca2+-transporting ATPase
MTNDAGIDGEFHLARRDALRNTPGDESVSTGTQGGLTHAEAARRLAAEGPNTLPGARRRGPTVIALEVLREPMFLLLLAGAAIYLLLGDVHEALVLAASIVVIFAIAVVQEGKSERALAALRDLSSPRALVIRDGAPVRIPGGDVVRGDLVVVAEGDRVPADLEIVAANDLMVDESLLTGESLPVEKHVDGPAYGGTLVVKGQGRGVVTAVGLRTEFGRIGQSLVELDIERTHLQQETARIVRLVAVVGAGACVALAVYSAVRLGSWLAGVLAGITLAMAILPEEFPLVLTVFLALGAWRIARRGVLTRRMPAIETLGAATVLCVDKTGTLTENRMALVDTQAAGTTAQHVVEAAALACELDPFDPMERAIVAAAGPSGETLRATGVLERDYPLTSEFLAVCHAWRTGTGERRVAVKGAPETVARLCRLDPASTERVLAEVHRATANGWRILAVGEAAWGAPAWADDPRAYPFIWLGFVALADPLRHDVPEAIAQCRAAGVRVVMITGDYPGTALTIARQAGISTEGGVLTGADIAAMDEPALAHAVRRVNVFARVRPEQKLRLITAYKTGGEVVGMTGDGVNDAPALRAASIGIAMGRRGTDVAREAAALVLVDDDFQSIVAAIRLGRRVYENIRNAMRYLLAVHVPIVGMSFLPLLLGWPVLLYPVHIVFFEFVIDPACSLVFEAEATDDGVMRRPPREPRERLFSAQMVGVSLLLGASVLATIFFTCWWLVARGLSDGETRSLGFAAIVWGTLTLIHATRSRDRSILQAMRASNPLLWWITGATVAALAVAIYVPPVAAVFRLAPLAPELLAASAAAGLLGPLWYEVYKLRRPRRAAARDAAP